MLHRQTGHGEAVARITWCVDQRAIRVITSEHRAALPDAANEPVPAGAVVLAAVATTRHESEPRRQCICSAEGICF
jgi:hypothetical protein